MATEKNIDEVVDGRVQVSSIRWMLGIVIVLIGAYVTLASFFYLFHWKADCSLLSGLAELRPDIEPSYGNVCGGIGARLADLLIGRSFGVAGIILPIYLIILGVNIIRGSKQLIINRDTLTMFLFLILSSLTLGAIFSSSWDLFGTGLGGAFGLEVSKILFDSIGIGLILLLIAAWFAVGVFINSNFINVVNRAGSTALSNTDKVVSLLKRNKKVEDEESDIPAVSTQAQDVAEAEPQPEIQVDLPVAESIAPVEPLVVQVVHTTNPPQTINDIYTGSNLEVEEESVAQSDMQESVLDVVHPERSASSSYYDDDDNPFIEVLGSRQTEAEIESESGDQEPQIEAVDTENEVGLEGGEGAVVFVEVNKVKEVDESDIDMTLYDPTKDINNYVKPPISLLEDYQSGVGVSDGEIYENKSKIEETLNHFGIPIQQNIKATVGPTITLYEIVQANGVKISKIQGLENDIAQRLKALGIRIIAPIPGAGTIGVELPNRTKQIVSMRSAILSPEFQSFKAQLPVVIGRTIQNGNYVFDLAKMPHLLVAGATGQGKSVGLNAIITSLLYSKHPSELKFVMIDPKMVEFSPYKKLENHYMAKMESEEDVIITDPKKAVYALNSICEEMESRLKLLSQAGVRNVVEYNDKFNRRALNPDNGHFFMPYIVVIIDEFADLIMTAKEVEMPVMRIAQKARAVGIHLIVATQRPDVKVITGGIKANFPARIAFKVTQMIDSRTIIDQPGANQLIGRGDMLFSKDGELTRIQCALVETDEVVRIVDHIGSQVGYAAPYPLPDYTPDSGNGDFDLGESGPAIKYDSLFAEIARAAVSNGGISTSAIQRNFEVGFNRAGRIMTQMERAGIVGRQEGSKPRDMLFYDMPSLEAKLQELGLF